MGDGAVAAGELRRLLERDGPRASSGEDGAFAGKPLDRGQPDAAAGAGEQYPATFQAIHAGDTALIGRYDHR